MLARPMAENEVDSSMPISLQQGESDRVRGDASGSEALHTCDAASLDWRANKAAPTYHSS